MHQELLQNDLETFLTWFSKQEDIPLQTRRDFFRHLSEVGYLDIKSREFLAEIIPKIPIGVIAIIQPTNLITTSDDHCNIL